MPGCSSRQPRPRARPAGSTNAAPPSTNCWPSPRPRWPTRARLVAFRAFVDHLSGRLDDARDLVRRELAGLAPDAVAARAALRIELATDALLRNDHAALAENAEAALGDAERAGGSALLAAAAVMCAIGHYHGARVRAARVALDRAATLVDATAGATLAARLDVVPSLALAECNLERFTAAIAHADRALHLADTGGRALMQPALHAVRGLANAHLGRIDAALADTAMAYEASVLTGSAWTASAARGLSSWLHTWTGDLDVALAHADEASRIGTEISSASRRATPACSGPRRSSRPDGAARPLRCSSRRAEGRTCRCSNVHGAAACCWASR